MTEKKRRPSEKRTKTATATHPPCMMCLTCPPFRSPLPSRPVGTPDSACCRCSAASTLHACRTAPSCAALRPGPAAFAAPAFSATLGAPSTRDPSGRHASRAPFAPAAPPPDSSPAAAGAVPASPPSSSLALAAFPLARVALSLAAPASWPLRPSPWPHARVLPQPPARRLGGSLLLPWHGRPRRPRAGVSSAHKAGRVSLCRPIGSDCCSKTRRSFRRRGRRTRCRKKNCRKGARSASTGRARTPPPWPLPHRGLNAALGVQHHGSVTCVLWKCGRVRG